MTFESSVRHAFFSWLWWLRMCSVTVGKTNQINHHHHHHHPCRSFAFSERSHEWMNHLLFLLLANFFFCSVPFWFVDGIVGEILYSQCAGLGCFRSCFASVLSMFSVLALLLQRNKTNTRTSDCLCVNTASKMTHSIARSLVNRTYYSQWAHACTTILWYTTIRNELLKRADAMTPRSRFEK